MKLNNNHHLRQRVLTLLLAVVTLGCTDEMHELYPDDDTATGLKLEFQASIDQVTTSRADETGFADGDRFGVFVVNYKDGTPGVLTLSSNQVNNVAVGYNADSNTWTPVSDIYWLDDQTRADVYGYYPFNNALADVDKYYFEVNRDQSIAAADGEMGSYEASDFLWAKTAGAKPGEKVSLSFGHALAGVKVMLQKGSGFDGDEWEKLPKIVSVDNTVRTATVDLSTGIVTPSGSYDRNIVMNADADGWRAVVVPQTVAAGKSTIGVTLDGVAYTLTRNDAMTYTPGKLHTFTISIDKKGAGGDYSLTLVNEVITPWESDMTSHDFVDNAYTTVHCPEPGKLRDVLKENNIDFNTIHNLKVTGILTTEDIYLMRDELPALMAVNLKEVKMVNVRHRIWDENDNEIFNDLIDDVLPKNAFHDKPTLRRIILPEGIKILEEHSLSGLSLNSTLIIPESVTHIMFAAFGDIREGAAIIMPHHLEYIGGWSFYNCRAEIDLYLANSINYIGGTAFWNASNVHGILSIPNKLRYLGDSSLTLGNQVEGEIVIPTSITEILNNTFWGLCIKGGTKVSLHDGITKIGDGAFSKVPFASGFTLPKNLKEIGREAFSWSHFTDALILPESIESIGIGAFAHSNLSGTLRIPERIEILSPTKLVEFDFSEEGSFAYTQLENVIIGDNVEIIGGRAFRVNEFLRSVEIGKNVTRIGTEAFADCPGLQTVVCMAKEPPTLYENVFTGCNLQQCHLEVPEESVDLYKAANGWKEFLFISPHRELSVGIHNQTCLNKGITRSTIIYSEGKWRVKNAPSWIHVSPDHGDYKEEITITVDPLATGAGNRDGKVEFELISKDYTTECEFVQYDYDKDEDTPIVLQQASAEGKGVNVFIVGDGFGAEEIISGGYLDHMNETMEQFFAIEPYKSYRSHFNVTTSIALSPDNSVSTLLNDKIDRLNTVGVDMDVIKVMDYAKAHSGFISSENIDDALLIVVSNMNAFAGSVRIESGGCALACISLSTDTYPYDQRGLVQHVAGGSAFACLAEEYVTHLENIKGCTCPGCNDLLTYYEMKRRGMFENVSLSGKINDAPWREFIFHPKYSAIVDMWEGAYNHYGVWRSENQSVMSTYIAYFNTISRYAIYKAIMRRAGLSFSIEDFIANDKIELP